MIIALIALSVLTFVLGFISGIFFYPIVLKGLEKSIYNKAYAEAIKGLNGNPKKVN